jgi:hypothetical protein
MGRNQEFFIFNNDEGLNPKKEKIIQEQVSR